jgi:hypothetical protein
MLCSFRWAIGSAFLVCAVLLTGCSNTNAVYPVKGKISFEGQPMMGGGSIALYPLSGQKGKMAGGIVAEDGSYVLTTNREGDGSMPGEFRVVITQQTEQEPEATPDGQAPAKAKSVPQANRIPNVFSDPIHSPTKITVKPENNEINIDLKRSDVPPPTRPKDA